MKNILFLFLATVFFLKGYGQNKVFPKDPQDAKFITSDLKNFRTAFDTSKNNPFENYIKNGTPGLQGFIANRIINDDSLLSMVKRRKQDYEKKRGIEKLAVNHILNIDDYPRFLKDNGYLDPYLSVSN